jgi:hypothetical protein
MDTDLTDHGGEFEEVTSRRRRKRLRQSSQQQVQKPVDNKVTDAVANRKTASVSQKISRKPLVIGRRAQSPGMAVIASAKPRLAKEVFCIDNVDVSLSDNDIIAFVKDMHVRVHSCFETQPRRSAKQRQRGEVPDDRKAFRLCILQEDRDNLLDPDNWPANITVSSWFFKGQSTVSNPPGASVGSGVFAPAGDKTGPNTMGNEDNVGLFSHADDHGGL